MQTNEIPAELLVPPRRLGHLLADARVSHGYSLAEASAQLGGGWSAVSLLEVETGSRPMTDNELSEVAGLYEIETSSLIPARSHLVVDLSEGTLAVGGQMVEFHNEVVERREVLAQYLAMVYSMREIRPGTPVPLRLPDLEILSGVLSAPRRQVEDELHSLMQDQLTVSSKVRGLRGRVLIPVIGVVVAATAAGVLLLVSDDSDAAPVGGGDAVTTVSDGAADAGSGAAVEAEIGDAVVQERLPDGTPGPVTPRG